MGGEGMGSVRGMEERGQPAFTYSGQDSELRGAREEAWLDNGIWQGCALKRRDAEGCFKIRTGKSRTIRTRTL